MRFDGVGCCCVLFVVWYVMLAARCALCVVCWLLCCSLCIVWCCVLLVVAWCCLLRVVVCSVLFVGLVYGGLSFVACC